MKIPLTHYHLLRDDDSIRFFSTIFTQSELHLLDLLLVFFPWPCCEGRDVGKEPEFSRGGRGRLKIEEVFWTKQSWCQVVDSSSKLAPESAPRLEPEYSKLSVNRPKEIFKTCKRERGDMDIKIQTLFLSLKREFFLSF